MAHCWLILLFTRSFPKLLSSKSVLRNWCPGLFLPQEFALSIVLHEVCIHCMRFLSACWGLDSSTTLGFVSHVCQLGVMSTGIHHSMMLCVKKMLNRTGTSIALCDTPLVTQSPTILCAEDQHSLQLASQCTSLAAHPVHHLSASVSASYTSQCYITHY